VQEIPNINGEVNVAFMRISETLLGIFIVHRESCVVLSRLDRVYRRYTDVRSEEATLTLTQISAWISSSRCSRRDGSLCQVLRHITRCYCQAEF